MTGGPPRVEVRTPLAHEHLMLPSYLYRTESQCLYSSRPRAMHELRNSRTPSVIEMERRTSRRLPATGANLLARLRDWRQLFSRNLCREDHAEYEDGESCARRTNFHASHIKTSNVTTGAALQ
jgi:hypothetical protein